MPYLNYLQSIIPLGEHNPSLSWQTGWSASPCTDFLSFQEAINTRQDETLAAASSSLPTDGMRTGVGRPFPVRGQVTAQLIRSLRRPSLAGHRSLEDWWATLPHWGKETPTCHFGNIFLCIYTFPFKVFPPFQIFISSWSLLAFSFIICSVLGRAMAWQPNICKIVQSSLCSWTMYINKRK